MRRCCLYSSWLLALAGCGDAPQADLPSYSPSSVSAKAVAAFDQNKDGLLDANELAQAPGLQSAAAKIDASGDQKLSAAEIGQRVAYYRGTRTGYMGLALTITRAGQPLADTVVTLTPEPCLEGEIKPASATTGTSGVAAPRIDGSEFPGVSPGFYRVSISKKDSQGQETLDAKYNTATTLGLEVAPDVPGVERGVTFDVK